MASVLFSPLGVFVAWAPFPFTDDEAMRWIAYPARKPDGARIFPSTDADAQALADILGA